MSKAHGQLRSSQIITTYGPGALIDLPRDSGIIGGLDWWPNVSDLVEISEPRLSGKLELMTGVKAPHLYAPPPAPNHPRQANLGIRVWRFPEWFVVQEDSGAPESGSGVRSRRLVHREQLDEKGRYEGRQVVATRFVRACRKGHVDDIDWRGFVHRGDPPCARSQLWLDERGTTGDLAELYIRCQGCGKTRALFEASEIERNALGTCSGRRPWLGPGHYADETCKEPSRLLVRAASNSYFPQVVSVLSLPDRGTDVERVVRELWEDLQIVSDPVGLAFMKQKPKVVEKLAPFSDSEVLEAIKSIKSGGSRTGRSRRWSSTPSSLLLRGSARMCLLTRISTSAASPTIPGGMALGSSLCRRSSSFIVYAK